MESEEGAKETVMSYIRALDAGRYDEALAHLHERVRIKGPAGETFGKPLDFIEMLRKYKGKYDIKKVFADGKDVCVLYDLATTGSTVYMSSWYQVREGKIASVVTVFDPRAFGPPPGDKSTRGPGR
jgi:SnoaL-like protein